MKHNLHVVFAITLHSVVLPHLAGDESRVQHIWQHSDSLLKGAEVLQVAALVLLEIDHVVADLFVRRGELLLDVQSSLLSHRSKVQNRSVVNNAQPPRETWVANL